MSEKKLPKGEEHWWHVYLLIIYCADVTKALKACQKHLDKVVKYMDEISQRPIGAVYDYNVQRASK